MAQRRHPEVIRMQMTEGKQHLHHQRKQRQPCT
jgi:hypothetical protein